MSDDEIIIYEAENDDAASDSQAEDKSIIVVDKLLPSILPIIPLYDRPLFPKMMQPIMITQDILKKIIKGPDDKGPHYLGMVYVRTGSKSQEQEFQQPKTQEDLYAIGTVAKILQLSPSKEGQQVHVMVQTLERFKIIEMTTKEIPFQAKISYLYETKVDPDEEMKAFSASIINTIKELVGMQPLFKEQLSLLMGQINVFEPGMLADISASVTTADGKELQSVLETLEVTPRLEAVLALLKKEVEIAKLQVQINKRIDERMTTQKREFFLKQQLKEIKKELGLTKEDKDTEVEKYVKRMKDLALPEEARERIDEEMEKIKVLEPSSPEYNVTRAYLDWLTILPWGIHTEDNTDIKAAAKILDRDHFGLTDVKDRIIELISVGILKGDLAGSILLFVGAPGVGKTSIGQSIAKSLGRKFFRFSLGGMRDEAEIKGHRRTYIGALPGKFIQTLKTCKSANPVIMLDEIDKIGASFQGDPASALLEVLDPEQNKDFLDHYLDVRFDLSKILFLCTANQLETIPRPLLDRMEVIRLSGYVLEEKMEIAKKYLIPKQLEMHGLKFNQVTFTDGALSEMIDGYAREAGVRSLENNIRKIMRKSSKKIVETPDVKIRIRKQELYDLLGRRTFQEEKLYAKPRVGVVTGLAYTELGGATLFIEATKVPSKNSGFKQTGQLGKVMVESSEIAYTVIRSMMEDSVPQKDFFSSHFIHLHVPAGATPKDGPSAGITMACALYSLAMEIPIKENLAMTGELTLTGLVMPIGGVKEKVIAAKRAKITQLIFPAENKKDFEELEPYITKGMTPFFVSTIEEVVQKCFPPIKKQRKKK